MDDHRLVSVERRQVSNETLAYQLESIQRQQTENSALLREQIREGFQAQERRLDKHDDLIAGVREQLVAMGARTDALETFRAAQEKRNEEAAREIATAARVNELDADKARTLRLVGATAVAFLGAAGTAVGIITAFT